MTWVGPAIRAGIFATAQLVRVIPPVQESNWTRSRVLTSRQRGYTMAMSIVDIPEQVGRVFKYSLRTKTSFVLSLFTAVLVLGFAWDLLYEFFYTRILGPRGLGHDAYGPDYWVGLGVFGAVLPLGYGAIQIVRAWLLTRPFTPDKFGIAIAPFKVLTLDPTFLGTANKLGTLDEAMQQYFTEAKKATDNEGWLDEFSLRFLPPYVRIENREQANRWRTRLNAALVVSGEVVVEGQKLQMRQELAGTEVSMHIKGGQTADLDTAGQLLAVFALSSAGFILRDQGKRERAIQMFSLAHSVSVKLPNQGGSITAGIQQQIDNLNPPKKGAAQLQPA